MPLIGYEEALACLAREEGGKGWLPWCEAHGIYQLPTAEWVEVLANTIRPLDPKRILELGAGSGALGRARMDWGICLRMTDPAGDGDVERLDAAKALSRHHPDMVVSCWLPFDLGAGNIIMADPRVRWHLAIVQEGPGFAGTEVLWRNTDWSSRRIEAADHWSISRSDYLTEGVGGEHIRHGTAYLFERHEN